MRLGNHTSKSGSFESAALKAAEIGANTFQIFSSSPRTWRAGTPDPADIRKLEAARRKHDLYPLVVHSNYLINLAATEGPIRAQSIAAFRSELERSMAIGADYVVVHPGSYRGRTCEEGILQVVDALIEAARGLRSRTTTILLENTAGAGCHIGGRFEELEAIRHFAHRKVKLPIGFCIDTCHCLASNYDVSTAEGLRDTVRKLEAAVGLDNVHVIHTNDSKYPLGSHVDRHANIGEGYIGSEGFRRILTHPKLRSKPFILETPVDEPGDDRRNLETLKNLCRRSSTTIARSS
ncbi:MAG TPA: deoxyribonuclease IV [Bryobacteraceae bacterium]|nr:deoxyribonuclease IV [Bryobacteraceae bacterium]